MWLALQAGVPVLISIQDSCLSWHKDTNSHLHIFIYNIQSKEDNPFILSNLHFLTSSVFLMFSKSSYLCLDEELPDRRERAARKKMEWHTMALLQMEYDRGSPQTCHLVYNSIHYFVKPFCFVLILCSSQLKVTLSHKKLGKMDRICRLSITKLNCWLKCLSACQIPCKSFSSQNLSQEF